MIEELIEMIQSQKVVPRRIELYGSEWARFLRECPHGLLPRPARVYGIEVVKGE